MVNCNAVLYPIWETSTRTRFISTWISNSEGTIIWQDSCPDREEFSFASKTAAVKGIKRNSCQSSDQCIDLNR